MKRWQGKLLGVIAGVALMRGHPLLGAVLGLLIGHAIDADWFRVRRSSEDPYAILGLEDDASDAEIDKAYRRLISQYHPDKLSGAESGLRRQAETKARDINGAYDRIKVLRKRP